MRESRGTRRDAATRSNWIPACAGMSGTPAAFASAGPCPAHPSPFGEGDRRGATVGGVAGGTGACFEARAWRPRTSASSSVVLGLDPRIVLRVMPAGQEPTTLPRRPEVARRVIAARWLRRRAPSRDPRVKPEDDGGVRKHPPTLSPVPNQAVHSRRPCPAEGRRPVPAPVVVGRGRRPRRRNPVTIGGAGPPSRGAVRKARRHYDRLCVGAPLRASGLPHLESRQRPAPGEWNGRRQVAEAGARMAPLLDCPSGARRAPATLGIAGGNETTHTPAATRRGIAGACPGTKKGGAPGAPPLRQAPKGAAPISAAARCGCRASAPSSRPARSSSHRRC